MQQEERKPSGVFPLKVDESGRLVLPAESRVRQAARAGETLVGVEEPDGSFKVQTHAEVIREIQNYFAQFVKPGESWSEELMRERREEAARE